MNPWLCSERVCWQVGVSVCGFVLCSSPAWAGKVSWWLSGGSELRLCLRWASLKCCQTKRTHFPCSPFPQSNMLRVWIVITVKSAFGTCLASSAQPWGGSRAVSGSATGSVCVCALLCLWHTLKYLCLCQREGEGAGPRGVSAKKNSHTWRVIYFLLIGFPCLYSPPLSALLPAVIFRFWQKLLIWCPELSFCGHKGAFLYVLFCGWYRKLWLSLSDEQIKRFDNDFDASGKSIY